MRIADLISREVVGQLAPEMLDRERRRKERQQHRRRMSRLIRGYKAACGCLHCGDRDPDHLTFHHRDPASKRFWVGGAAAYSIKSILQEIDKCDVVCRTCHDRLHGMTPRQKETK
jgi:hypothetical protein